MPGQNKRHMIKHILTIFTSAFNFVKINESWISTNFMIEIKEQIKWSRFTTYDLIRLIYDRDTMDFILQHQNSGICVKQLQQHFKGSGHVQNPQILSKSIRLTNFVN